MVSVPRSIHSIVLSVLAGGSGKRLPGAVPHFRLLDHPLQPLYDNCSVVYAYCLTVNLVSVSDQKEKRRLSAPGRWLISRAASQGSQAAPVKCRPSAADATPWGGSTHSSRVRCTISIRTSDPLDPTPGLISLARSRPVNRAPKYTLLPPFPPLLSLAPICINSDSTAHGLGLYRRNRHSQVLLPRNPRLVVLRRSHLSWSCAQ